MVQFVLSGNLNIQNQYQVHPGVYHLVLSGICVNRVCVNDSQLAKMKKYIPHMSLP